MNTLSFKVSSISGMIIGRKTPVCLLLSFQSGYFTNIFHIGGTNYALLQRNTPKHLGKKCLPLSMIFIVPNFWWEPFFLHFSLSFSFFCWMKPVFFSICVKGGKYCWEKAFDGETHQELRTLIFPFLTWHKRTEVHRPLPYSSPDSFREGKNLLHE